jgi:protein-disulfide isomerase
MITSRILTGLVLCLSLGASAGLAAEGQNDTVIAQVNGDKLTFADLERKQPAKLLQARYQHYRAERDALDQLIDDHLLEMQAQREKLTIEQLLERHVTSQVKDPTEEQVQGYYEGMQTDEPFAAVRDKILDRIRQVRLAKARAVYRKSLRSQANIHVLLAPPSVEVALGSAPTRGSRNAPVIIIEFADYECPYCQKIDADLKKLQEEFGGNLGLVFKDFPLPMHSRAEKAAEAARCADAQGKFWEFHDFLFDNSKNLEATHLKEYARALKLDAARFDGCLDLGEQAATVQMDSTQAQRLGLTGTPSFFINGHLLSGAVNYSTLREMVEQELAASLPSTKESARK